MVLDIPLLNTQQYKVRIKGKVEQSWKGVPPSATPRCSSYWKGSLLVTLDYGRQLYLFSNVKLKKYNIIISRIISNHMSPMYIERPYRFMLSHPYIYTYIHIHVAWFKHTHTYISLVGFNCRIRQLQFCIRVKPSHLRVSWYDTKLHLIVRLQSRSLEEC